MTTEIEVRAERPYEVVVGHAVLPEVTALLGEPRRVAVLHPAALVDVAVRVTAGLEEAGHEVVRIDVPDAEAAKTSPRERRKRHSERPAWESNFYNDEVATIVADYVSSLGSRDAVRVGQVRPEAQPALP